MMRERQGWLSLNAIQAMIILWMPGLLFALLVGGIFGGVAVCSLH
jgi:hypothetical protein